MTSSGGPRRRRLFAGQRGIAALFVIRLLLVANGLTLVAVGVLYLVYGSRPAGLIVGGVLVAAAVVLFALVPLTDPYRRRR